MIWWAALLWCVLRPRLRSSRPTNPSSDARRHGFDEAVRRHKWEGTRAVVPYLGPRGCTRCSIGVLVRMTSGVQSALFFHGGFGASERRTVDVCLACGRVVVVGLETLNPRRVA